MATIAAPAAPIAERHPTDWTTPAMQSRIAARYRAERNFRRLGAAALVIAASFLAFLLFTIVRDGWTGFQRTETRIDVQFDAATLGADPAAVAGPQGQALLARADYQALLLKAAEQLGPADDTLSDAAWMELRAALMDDPALLGKRANLWVPVRSSIDLLAKGKYDLAAPAESRGVTDREVSDWRWLEGKGLLRTGFNTTFLFGADSTEPELAGIGGAALGSLLTLAVTIAIAFPLGVFSAVWLEEFAPKGRLADIIELSINSLAAVPSIIFGLLGLAFFLNFAGMPRSAPLVGGITLALMIMPVIVIAARVAIKAVPPSIRDAALGIGASPIQVVFHHVLPLALPGIMTGTIIGIARALGETAPLLLIGMRAFVTDVPQGFTSPATVLPMQVFLWSDDVQRGFVEKTSAAIMVLMLVLIAMNSLAIYLRSRFEEALVNQNPAIGHNTVPKMTARDVNVFYGQKQAIKNVSIDVSAEHVTAFIGPSGCGKSTFLRCLNRMNDTVDGARVEGRIELDGQDVYASNMDVVQLRARAGMVFQKPNPFPKSIYENVAYGPRLHGLARSKADMDEIVESALKRAGLWDEAKDRLNESGTAMSGGQQQRLCIARAIAVDPEVILMDEPCSALDPIATARIEELIDELRGRYAIVIVTHNMQQAARVSQKTAFFHLGTLVEYDDTSSIFTNPKATRTKDYITGRYG